MRKFLSVLLVSLLVFSFTACSGEESSQGSGEESMEISAQESTEKDEVDFSQEEDALDAGQTLEPENKGENQAAGSILIVYFSRWGNTDYPEDVDAATSASIVVDGDGRYGTTEYIANMIECVPTDKMVCFKPDD